MFTKASVMQKYYIKAIQHQNEFPNEIWHFESQCHSERSNAAHGGQQKII